MEMIQISKRLHRHTTPIIILIATLMVLPIVAASRYNSPQLGTEASLAKGLVTRVLHVQPTTNGLAKFTFDATDESSASIDGSPGLQQDSLSQTGHTAQLLLDIQASPTTQ